MRPASRRAAARCGRSTGLLFAALLFCLPAWGLGRGEQERAAGGPPEAAPPAAGPPADERFAQRRDERNALVDRYVRAQGIGDPRVIAAMRAVPRHLFVPPALAPRAYADTALPIGYGQTISQPYVVAFMTEALDLAEGDKVLEVGTGSGYQAAILAEIVEQVYSIEIVPELAEQVRTRLASLGYGAVRLREGDGYFGWSEKAPFDKMIVTAAVDHVPPPLLQQLAPGGRMILPVGPPGGVQTLLLITKRPDGNLERTSLLSVVFVPMTGRALQ